MFVCFFLCFLCANLQIVSVLVKMKHSRAAPKNDCCLCINKLRLIPVNSVLMQRYKIKTPVPTSIVFKFSTRYI